MATWYNNDGLRVPFGKDTARETKGIMAAPSVDGVIQQMVVDINYDDLPGFTADLDNDGTLDGFDAQTPFIPAGSYITRAFIIVETAFAGGTSYDIGLYDEDGNVIDADGIDAAVGVAALGANAAVACDGALVGGTSTVGAKNAYLVVAATGNFTAGKAKLVIEYVPVSVGATVGN